MLTFAGVLITRRVNWWDAPQDPNVWQKHHVSKPGVLWVHALCSLSH